MTGCKEFLYIMENQAWPCWYKLGRTCDLQETLKIYNRCSPYVDYSLVYSAGSYDIISDITQAANILLQYSSKTKLGWYFIPKNDIQKAINSLDTSWAYNV